MELLGCRVRTRTRVLGEGDESPKAIIIEIGDLAKQRG